MYRLEYDYHTESGWGVSCYHSDNLVDLLFNLNARVLGGSDLIRYRVIAPSGSILTVVEAIGRIRAELDSLALLISDLAPTIMPNINTVDPRWLELDNLSLWWTSFNPVDTEPDHVKQLAMRSVRTAKLGNAIDASNRFPTQWYHLWHDDPDNPDQPHGQLFAIIHSGVVTYHLPFPETTETKAEIMPNTDSSADSTVRPPDMMAKIAITRCKETNKLLLTIDAKPLHDLLDSIGCVVDGTTYKERPSASFSTVEGNTISTELLLKRQYPVKVSLSGLFRTPPTLDSLRAICGSAHNQIRTILQHYQPIDISVTINKKLVG